MLCTNPEMKSLSRSKENDETSITDTVNCLDDAKDKAIISSSPSVDNHRGKDPR